MEALKWDEGSGETEYTVRDIEALPEGERAELIDGRMYLMATPSTTHQRISMDLSVDITNYIREKGGSCQVFAAPFAVYPKRDDRNYVEPDISVICDPDKLDEKGCHGVPDWVIEVVSPSTQNMDYLTKLLLYKESGAREYWIVDPLIDMVAVYGFEQDTVYHYHFGEEIPVGIFPGLTLRIRVDQQANA